MPVEVFRTPPITQYHDVELNIKIYIEWRSLHIESNDYNYTDIFVEIKYCPMCGKKL